MIHPKLIGLHINLSSTKMLISVRLRNSAPYRARTITTNFMAISDIESRQMSCGGMVSFSLKDFLPACEAACLLFQTPNEVRFG